MPNASAPAPEAARARSSANPLVALRRGGPRQPFFCCAAGFGDVLALARLAQRLGADRAIYALQAALPPERGWAPAERLDALAELYLARLAAVQPRGPYLLGGNSCGGLVALELARRLRARGEEVALLALLDAPDRIGWLEYGLHYSVANAVRRVMPRARPDAPVPFRTVRAFLSDEGLERHFLALRGYRAAPYGGRTVLFHARGRYLGVRFASPRRWRALIEGDLVVETLPGDHISFLRGDNLAALGERLRAHLDAAPD